MQIGHIISSVKFHKYIYLAPVLSAVILIFAFPRFDQGYLAWIGLLPFIWFCLKVNRATSFHGGVLFGFIFHSYINSYLAVLFLDYLNIPLALFTFLLMLLFLSLFYGVFACLVSHFHQFSPPAVTALVVPTLWITMEYARSLGLLGYTAGYIGYSQWMYPFLLNTVSLYGYWGLAFLMVLVQVILVLRFCKLLETKTLGRLAIITACLLIVGLWIPSLFPEMEDRSTHKIALVQPNNPQQALIDSDPGEILDRYLDLSQDTLEKNPELDLVVWPETAVNYSIGEGNPLIEEVKNLAQDYGVPILYGAVYLEEEARYNSIVLWEPEAEEAHFYYKNRLVPVVEYFPFPDLLNRVVDVDLVMGEYQPGEKAAPLPWEGDQIGGVVCFESYFGDYTRKLAYQQARHLFVLTNDGWFDGTIGMEQHAYVGALRAAEMGMGVTQVANTGITLSFDHRGEKIFESPSMERDVFLMETGFPRRPTVYQYAGEYFLYLSFLTAVCLLLVSYRRR